MVDIIKNKANEIDWEDYSKDYFDEQEYSSKAERRFITELNDIMKKNSSMQDGIKSAVSLTMKKMCIMAG